jgi:tetratricopeptide repeat protein
MTIRNKKIIIIISIIFVLIFTIFLISYNYSKRKDAEFVHEIKELDKLLLNESVPEAVELIPAVLKLASSPMEFKQLIKRIYYLNNTEYYSIVSKEAFKKYSKDEDITSIYIHSLLITDQIDLALDVLTNSKSIHTYNNLYLEAMIKSGEAGSEQNDFYSILHRDDVSTYNRLYQVTNDKNFLLNSVLLYLEEGNYSKAEELIDTVEIERNKYLKLHLLTKYSSGNYDEVLQLLSIYDFGYSIEELTLIRIDIEIKKGQLENALNKIMEFTYLFPDFSPLPYRNLIRLNSKIDIPAINELIEIAVSNFPDNKQLILELIEYNYDEKIIISLIKNYLLKYPKDKEVEIKKREILGNDNPEVIINNLYELLNSDPDNPYTRRFLAWNLYENNSINDLEKFIKQNEKEHTGSWNIFFEALVSESKGNSNLAIQQFETAYSMTKNWENLYNLAVISENNGKYEQAIAYYQNAENSLNQIPENYKTKSMIRTSLASLFYNLKDYEKAFREIRNALDQDPANLKAYLLLKKLESSTY